MIGLVGVHGIPQASFSKSHLPLKTISFLSFSFSPQSSYRTHGDKNSYAANDQRRETSGQNFEPSTRCAFTSWTAALILQLWTELFMAHQYWSSIACHPKCLSSPLFLLYAERSASGVHIETGYALLVRTALIGLVRAVNHATAPSSSR